MTARGPIDRGRLAAGLLGPGQPEVSCDECFDQLDRYVELELAGDEPERRIPGMRAHLAGCPACAEEHESLLAFARQERGEER
jgi:hypothetical protein